MTKSRLGLKYYAICFQMTDKMKMAYCVIKYCRFKAHQTLKSMKDVLFLPVPFNILTHGVDLHLFVEWMKESAYKS